MLTSEEGNLINHPEENVWNYTNINAKVLLTFEKGNLINLTRKCMKYWKDVNNTDLLIL